MVVGNQRGVKPTISGKKVTFRGEISFHPSGTPSLAKLDTGASWSTGSGAP